MTSCGSSHVVDYSKQVVQMCWFWPTGKLAYIQICQWKLHQCLIFVHEGSFPDRLKSEPTEI